MCNPELGVGARFLLPRSDSENEVDLSILCDLAAVFELLCDLLAFGHELIIHDRAAAQQIVPPQIFIVDGDVHAVTLLEIRNLCRVVPFGVELVLDHGCLQFAIWFTRDIAHAVRIALANKIGVSEVAGTHNSDHRFRTARYHAKNLRGFSCVRQLELLGPACLRGENCAYVILNLSDREFTSTQKVIRLGVLVENFELNDIVDGQTTHFRTAVPNWVELSGHNLCGTIGTRAARDGALDEGIRGSRPLVSLPQAAG